MLSFRVSVGLWVGVCVRVCGYLYRGGRMRERVFFLSREIMCYCVGVLKKKIWNSLEGGLVGEVKSDAGAGSVLLREPVVGSVWRGENQNS